MTPSQKQHIALMFLGRHSIADIAVSMACTTDTVERVIRESLSALVDLKVPEPAAQTLIEVPRSIVVSH